MQPPVAVSAIVLGREAGVRLERTLRALRDQEPAPMELAVADLGGCDADADWIRDDPIAASLLPLGGLSVGAAKNAALQLARAPLVLLIEPGVHLEKGALQRLLEAHERRGAAAVVPRLVALAESDQVLADGASAHFCAELRARHQHLPLAMAGSRCETVEAWLPGCLLLDREAVLRAGGFDEACDGGLEDLELALRLRALGNELVCEPSALARREPPNKDVTAPTSGSRRAVRERARWRTILVHYRLRTLALLAPALLARELAAFGTALRRGGLSAWLDAWRWQLAHADDTAARRAFVRQRRRRSDRALLSGGPLPHGADGLAPTARESGLVGRIVAANWRLARGRIG